VAISEDPSTWRWSKRDIEGRFSSNPTYHPGHRPNIEERSWLAIRGKLLSEVGVLIRAAARDGDIESPYHYTRLPVGLVEHEGNTLIWNNRTSAALTMGGIPRACWVIEDVTRRDAEGNAA
jgi:hypothetical protein